MLLALRSPEGEDEPRILRLAGALLAGRGVVDAPAPPASRPLPGGFPADGLEPRRDADEEEDEDAIPADRRLELSEIMEDSAPTASGDPHAPLVLEVVRSVGAAVESVWLRAGERFPQRQPLVRMERAGARLRLPPGADGVRVHLGQEEALPPGPADVRLEAGDRARVQVGDATWRLRVDHGAREAGRVAGVRRPWALYAACVGVAAGLHLLLVGGVVSLGALGVQLTVKADGQAERFVSLEQLKTPERPLPKPPPPPRPPPPAPTPRPSDAPRVEAVDPAEARPALPAAVQRRVAARRAEARSDAEALRRALDPGERDADAETLERVVRGMDALPQGGPAALEVANTGAGPADAPLDAGGRGARVDTGAEEAVARSGAGRMKAPTGPRRIRGKVQNVRALTKVTCDLDRSAVRQVVEAATGRITGCYEQALLKRADLSGKVTVEWAIDGRGQAVDVRLGVSTLGAPEVGACVLGVIRRLRFPSPPPGGTCVISYPFIFSTSR
ncbi:MAG: AgmX/PglI C-terminal domain-containing protein [Myxococcales bacterium]|nr:AgmX/PglI C-terminal domain-containing protein [Myxococcales bacterium]